MELGLINDNIEGIRKWKLWLRKRMKKKKEDGRRW